LTQVNYFGVGADSLVSQRSEYRLRDTDVAGYGIVRAKGWLSFGGRFGWMKQPTLSSSVGPFDQNFPDALLVFPTDPGITGQTSLLHGGATIEADTRDSQSRPTRGGWYRAAADAYSDRALHRFSFRRYEVEGLQFVPILGQRWVVALHGWGAFSDTPSDNSVPFYMLPSIGGSNTLRGYHDYRFHDRQMLVVNAESRWVLFSHVDAAAFVDAGNVAARVGALNLDKTSYGAGLRVHSRTSTVVRLDVAHGSEGWLLFFRLGDPFRFARHSLRTTGRSVCAVTRRTPRRHCGRGLPRQRESDPARARSRGDTLSDAVALMTGRTTARLLFSAWSPDRRDRLLRSLTAGGQPGEKVSTRELP
jgi:hypothetical protein